MIRPSNGIMLLSLKKAGDADSGYHAEGHYVAGKQTVTETQFHGGEVLGAVGFIETESTILNARG